MRTLIKIVFVLACLFLLFGCKSKGNILGYEQVSIKKLKANPHLFSEGKEYVEIEGIVTGGFNLFEQFKYIEICDENNDCIYSKPLHSIPANGTKVTLVGNTYEVFSLKEQSLVIFEEKSTE